MSRRAAAPSFFAMVVVLLMAPAMCGQTAEKGAAASEALRAQILANEKAVWEAAKQRDAARFRELVAPDARMIFSSGVKTRSEYLAGMDSRQILSYSIDDFSVFSPSSNTAVAMYRATISGVFGGKQVPPTTVREASLWVKRGHRWVAVLNQETPIQ